jgi:hypothetical protein
MSDGISEATIIAWIEGELSGEDADRVAHAVAADPVLQRIAERHRAMKARIAKAFGTAAEPTEPARRAPAPVISLAAARAERTERTERKKRPTPSRRDATPGGWAIPGAIAASLVVGALAGYGFTPPGVGDHPGALAVAGPIAKALDQQASGEAGPVRVALSFRDHDGQYCRSFVGTSLSGVACRAGDGWQLRYAAPDKAGDAAYRQAGGDTTQTQLIGAMIAGDPLDAPGEKKAREAGWR